MIFAIFRLEPESLINGRAVLPQHPSHVGRDEYPQHTARKGQGWPRNKSYLGRKTMTKVS